MQNLGGQTQSIMVFSELAYDAGSIQCRPSMASHMVFHIKPGPVGRL